MSLIFALYFSSQRAWSKTADHQEIMGNLQLAVAFLSQDLQAAPIDSISLAADGMAISCLTMKDSDGQLHFTADGRPIWDHWLVFYASGDKVFRREVPWPEAPSAREIPIKLEAYNGQTLASFRDGKGRVLTRRLDDFKITNPSGTSLFHYRLSVKRKKVGEPHLIIEGSIRPRN